MSTKLKVKTAPPYRKPTHIQDPQSYDTKQLRIRLDLLDFTHDLWGWETLSKEQYIVFLKFVQAVEKQTWAEIKNTSGGKRRETNHHPMVQEKENFSDPFGMIPIITKLTRQHTHFKIPS